MKAKKWSALILAAALLAASVLSGCGAKQEAQVNRMPETAAETTETAATETEAPSEKAQAEVKTAAQTETEQETQTEAQTEAKTSAAAEETEPKEQAAGETEEAAELPGEKAGTLADRLTGRYMAQLSEEECYVLDIFSLGGNLFAEAGRAVGSAEASDDPDIYSFWAMELIPSDPEAFLSTESDAADIGIMTFSVMSNLCRYWSAPEKCSIALTEDGVCFTGMSGAYGPLEGGGDRFELKRAAAMPDPAKAALSMMEEGFGDEAKEPVPGELLGVWKEKDAKDPLYFGFTELPGEETAGGFWIYRKEPGTEVRIERGAFFQSAGEFTALYTTFGYGGMPLSQNQGFSFEENGDLRLTGGFVEGEALFERVTEGDLPLTALCEPDDVAALSGALRAGSGDTERRVVPQFAAAEDIENNGGQFVRIGDLVFFRAYSTEAMAKTGALFGEFLNTPGLGAGSDLMYYDRRTGETGTAFTDSGFGPVCYVDGRFVTQMYIPETIPENDGEGYEPSAVYLESCWPDGSCRRDVTEAPYAVIDDVSEDGKYLMVHEYEGGEVCYVTAPDSYPILECPIGQGEGSPYAGFSGHDVLALIRDADGEHVRVFWYCLDNGDDAVLGMLPESETVYPGYPEVLQTYRDGDDIYIAVTWYEGSASEMNDYAVLKMQAGVPDSLEVLQRGIPDELGLVSSLYFYFNGSGELSFSEHRPGGELALADLVSGDLVYYDSPFGAVTVVKDYMKEAPYNAKNGETARILQKAEYVDGAAWIITAEGERSEEEDVGWRMGFKLKGMTWQRAVLENASPGGDGSYPLEELVERKAE